MATETARLGNTFDGEPIVRGTVSCCDCNRRIPRAKAISADPSNPPTPEDMARIFLVGPVRGLSICADREACKKAVETTRLGNFALACRAIGAFRPTR